MTLPVPVVWSEDCLSHEPDGEVWLGVREQGTEVSARALVLRDALTAAGALVVPAGNRLAEAERPWELARRAERGDRPAATRLDEVLGALTGACRTLATELGPFLPGGSATLSDQLSPQHGTIAPPVPVFARQRAGPRSGPLRARAHQAAVLKAASR